MGLDGVEFAMELEGAFRVEIPNELWTDLKTVGNVTDLICDLFELSERPADRFDILSRVRQIASQETGIPLERITEDSDLWKLFG